MNKQFDRSWGDNNPQRVSKREPLTPEVYETQSCPFEGKDSEVLTEIAHRQTYIAKVTSSNE
jgi:hypothetical protein